MKFILIIASFPFVLTPAFRDARRTLERGRKAEPIADGSSQVELAVPSFGYKNHVSMDSTMA